MTPEETLAGFIDAFNDLRTEEFLGYFSSDATFFQPLPAFPRRLTGTDARASWRAIQDGFRSSRSGPPYLSITPLDLNIQRYGEVAIATFHLVGLSGPILNRRTIVLKQEGADWKIVHLHASLATMPPVASAAN